jgi:hypothetical protein
LKIEKVGEIAVEAERASWSSMVKKTWRISIFAQLKLEIKKNINNFN